MKTIIYSTLTNNTFLETQYKSIKKYFQSEFEYIIFDDSRETENLISYNKIQTNDIKNTCDKLNIKYIRIPQKLHKNRGKVMPKEWKRQNNDEHPYEDHPVTRCALAVQYGFNYIINNYKDVYLFLIDSDMFLINYFDINTYMKDYHICGIPQSNDKIEYLWNGLFICNLSKCKNIKEFNWESGKVFILDENDNKTEKGIGCDVGGHNYYYLTKYGYFNENKNKLNKNGAMHIGLIDSIWLTGENGINYLDEKLINFIKKFCYLKSKPTDAEEGWINKELILKYNDKFTILHIRGGGGWCYHKEEYHKGCIQLINEYIESN
jgi:hypothetical protein